MDAVKFLVKAFDAPFTFFGLVAEPGDRGLWDAWGVCPRPSRSLSSRLCEALGLCEAPRGREGFCGALDSLRAWWDPEGVEWEHYTDLWLNHVYLQNAVGVAIFVALLLFLFFGPNPPNKQRQAKAATATPARPDPTPANVDPAIWEDDDIDDLVSEVLSKALKDVAKGARLH